MAAAGAKAFHMEDPVCGKDVDPDEAARVGLMSSFQGAPFVFCSPECKQIFDKNPRAILSRPPAQRAMPPVVPVPHEGGHGRVSPSMEEAMPPPLPQSQQLPGQTPDGGHSHDHGAAPAGAATMQVDPVCRMEVDPVKARAEGLFTELKGVTWFFDSPECKRTFDDDPTVFLPMIRLPVLR